MAEVLNLKNLKSIRLQATFHNVTSGWLPKKQDRFEVVEIGENTLVMEGPTRSCARGHLLEVDLKISFPAEPNPIGFAFSARVDRVELLKDSDRLDLVMVQFDSDTWGRILYLLSARQEEIHEYLRYIKGKE